MGFKQREGRRRGAREMSVYDEGKGLVARRNDVVRLPGEEEGGGGEAACSAGARR